MTAFDIFMFSIILMYFITVFYVLGKLSDDSDTKVLKSLNILISIYWIIVIPIIMIVGYITKKCNKIK